MDTMDVDGPEGADLSSPNALSLPLRVPSSTGKRTHEVAHLSEM